MKPYSFLQKVFWQLAQFNVFIVSFCPTVYNRFAAIGFHLFVQLLLAFVAGFIIGDIWPFIGIFSGPFAAAVLLWCMWHWVRGAAGLLQRRNSINVLILIFIANLIAAGLLTLPFCLVLFRNQSALAIAFNPGLGGRWWLGALIKPIMGLLFAGQYTGESVFIKACCGCLFLFIFLVTYLPYLLIHIALKSIHNIVIKTYEKHFTTTA